MVVDVKEGVMVSGSFEERLSGQERGVEEGVGYGKCDNGGERRGEKVSDVEHV